MVTLNVHAQQEGKRKIADNVFVPKGQWIVDFIFLLRAYGRKLSVLGH